MTSIFLSYARGDDGEPLTPATSFVARLHRDLITAGFAVWFDRVSMPSRLLTFHQEIRDAVAACDRVVLVVGPKAAESLYVRQEWQFAYFEAEKVVTPILRRGDYGNVPDELKLLHCEDFRDDGQYDFNLKNLIRQLAEPTPLLGKLIGVPSLPPHFLSRTERLAALRDALRADLDRPVVISGAAARVGMHGMGGIGKSVLAATLSRDRKVREAFPDGIVWVGLGPLPTVADLQRRVHKDLGGDGAFQTEHEGRVKLRDILKDKGVLLILDDVWRRADVDWFDVLGPRCRAMITTRDAGLLTSLGGVHHQVELLTDAEALNLLAQAAGVERDKLPSEADDLIAECGRLPLAVALCGGLIRHGFVWAKVLEQLRNSRIDRIKDPHAAKVEHESIWNAIDVSVKFLSADEQARFLELAVFPSDEATPIAALGTLWSHTAGFDDWDTDALVIKLSQRSLLQVPIRWIKAVGGDWDTAANWGTSIVPGSGNDAVIASPNSGAFVTAAGKVIALHDLVYDYVHRAAGDEAALHQRLLEAYRRKCPDGWHVDPPNDGYFFTHLRGHLIAAGRAGDLADLLHDLRWLEAKNEAGLTFDLTADFDTAMKAISETDVRQRNVRLLDEALRRDIHFIARHAQDYPQGLFQCLWNSCWWYDAPDAAAHYDLSKRADKRPLPWELPAEQRIATLLERWRAEKEEMTPDFVWLRSLRPPDSHLGTALKMTFKGHQHYVTSVSFSPDGSRIISGSLDETVRLWDSSNGEELLSIKARHGYVQCVSFSPDGQYFVSGGGSLLGSGALKIWNATRGDEMLCLTGHQDTVWSAMYSPDGRRIVSGSSDRTVRVWDSASGEELLCLEGHQDGVNSVGFSPDGRRIVSGSSDKSVRVWNSASGEQLLCLKGHQDCVYCVRFSPDGTRIACGTLDDTVQIWEAASGLELSCLTGHEFAVMSLGFSPDGGRIVSGSADHTVRVWDVVSGEELHLCEGHQRDVRNVGFSPDGGRIVSGSADNTVRVWDAFIGGELLHLKPGNHPINGIYISPDGSRIITGISAGGTQEWDAKKGECLAVRRDQIITDVTDGKTMLFNLTEGAGTTISRFPPRHAFFHTKGEGLEQAILYCDDLPCALWPQQLHYFNCDHSARLWIGEDNGYVAILRLEVD